MEHYTCVPANVPIHNKQFIQDVTKVCVKVNVETPEPKCIFSKIQERIYEKRINIKNIGFIFLISIFY